MAQPAAAQDRPLVLRLGSSLTWDANVFRLAETAADPQLAQGIAGKSDRITAANIGLRFDKAYSQQHILFDATRTATRYDKFTFLDGDAFNYRGAWEWHLSPRVSGTLSADRTEALISFDNTQILQRNVSVISNRNFAIDAWLFGGWHLLAGASKLERKNSLVFLAQPDSSQTSGEVGLRYVAESQSSITATRRSSRGANTGQAVDTFNFIDSGFTVQESELNATWMASGRSTLNGRMTRIERHNEHVPQRDFSGVAAELGHTWTPTGRLALNFSALRAVTSFALDTSSSYRVDDTLAFAPAWQVSDKIGLRMRAYRLVSDYRGPVVPVTDPFRHDILRSVQFAMDWSPHRKVTLSATLQRDRRSSNEAALKFDDTNAGLSASLAF